MASVIRRWIADNAVDNSKIDNTGNYSIGGLAVAPTSGTAIVSLSAPIIGGGRTFQIVSDATGALQIRDATSTRILIRQVGTVVIPGDASVIGGLQVDGTVTIVNKQIVISDTLDVNNDSDSTTAAFRQTNATISKRVMVIENAGTGPALTIDRGAVGIGTTAPVFGNKLQVVNTANAAVSFLLSGPTMGVRIGTTSTYGLIEGVDPTGGATFQPLYVGGSQVVFTTSSVNRAIIDPTGKVGIGTMSPTELLHIHGATDANLLIKSSSSAYGGGVKTSDSAGTGFSLNSLGSTHSLVAAGIPLANWSLGLNTSPGGLLFYQQATVPMVFATGDTERFRITGAGNIGIGTTNPAAYQYNSNANLVVQGSTFTNITVATTDPTKNTDIAFARGTTGSLRYMGLIQYSHANDRMDFFTAGGSKVTITSSGYMGVGTQSPNHLFEVFHDTAAVASIHSNRETAGDLATLFFSTVASATTRRKAAIFYQASGAGNGVGSLLFAINGAADASDANPANAKMILVGSTGYIGIGTTAPISKLTLDMVDGNITVQATSTLVVANSDPTTNNFSGISFAQNAVTSGGLPSGPVIAAKHTNRTAGARTSDLIFYSYSSSATSEAMRINSAGLVTIPNGATSAPLYNTSFSGLTVGGYGTTGNSAAGVFGSVRGILLIGGNSPALSTDVGSVKFLYAPLSTTDENTATIASIKVLNTTTSATSGGDMALSTRVGSGALTERVRITSTGLVGIGTTSPIYNVDTYASLNSTADIVMRNAGTGTGVMAGVYANTSSGWLGMRQYGPLANMNLGGLTLPGMGLISNDAPNGTLITQRGGAPLYFATGSGANNTVKFRIDGDGDIQLGPEHHLYNSIELGAGSALDWYHIGQISLLAQNDEVDLSGSIFTEDGAGAGLFKTEFFIKARQQAAMGSAPAVTYWKSSAMSYLTNEWPWDLRLLITQNNGTATRLDLYKWSQNANSTLALNAVEVIHGTGDFVKEITVQAGIPTFISEVFPNFSSTYSAPATSGTLRSMLKLIDQSATGAMGTGAGISLGANVSSARSTYELAGIQAYKANATPGDFGGQLHLMTTPSGGTPLTRMVITEAGRVGIGKTSVTTDLLEVVGSFRVSDNASETNALRITSTSTYSDILTRYATPLILGTSATERIRILSSGNVGIGTSIPGATLHVFGALLLQSGLAITRFDFDGGLTANQDDRVPTQKAVKTYVDAINQWLRIGSVIYTKNLTDFVGIGTTSPEEQLHILSSINSHCRIRLQPLTASYDSQVDLYNSTARSWSIISDTDAGNLLRINAGIGAGGDVFTLLQGGNVGIGTLNPTSKLHVYGDFRLLTGTAVNDISTDGVWASPSNSRLSTQQAIKTYVDNLISTSSGGWSRSSICGYLYLTTSTDKVGIGANPPLYPLHISVVQAAETAAVVQNTSSGVGARASFSATSDSNTTSLFSFGTGGTSGYGGIANNSMGGLLTNGASGMLLSTTSNTPLYFGSANSVRMTLTNTGGLGIGTIVVTGGALLQVNGLAKSTTLDVANSATVGTLYSGPAFTQGITAGGTVSICGQLNPAASDTYYIGAGLQRWKTVYATNFNAGDSLVVVNNVYSTGSGALGTDANRWSALYMASRIDFKTNPLSITYNNGLITHMTIAIDGKVGIKSTTPTARLDVAAANPGETAMKVTQASTGGGIPLSVIGWSSGIEITTASSGNLIRGINASGTPTQVFALDINGAVTTSGGVSAASVAATGAVSGATVSASGIVSGGIVTAGTLNATEAYIGGNTLIYGGTLSICGNIMPTAGGVQYLGAGATRWLGIYATNMNASGTITTGALTALGAISGASLSISGAFTPSSVSTPGAISGASLTVTGAISGASLSISGALSLASLSVTGAITSKTLNATSSATPGVTAITAAQTNTAGGIPLAVLGWSSGIQITASSSSAILIQGINAVGTPTQVFALDVNGAITTSGGVSATSFSASGAVSGATVSASGIVSGGTVNAGTLNATEAYIGGNVLIYGGTLSICGNIQPVGSNTYYLGFGASRWAGVYATNMNSNGTITAAVISASGAVSAASFSTSGAMSAASMSTSGSGSIGTSLYVGGGARITGGPLNLGSPTDDPSNDQGDNRINWGIRGDNLPYYCIRTNFQAPYSRLQIGWHTGVQIGGASAYGGTRFFNNSPGIAGTAELFSVGNGDNHVRVANTLYADAVSATGIVSGGIVTAGTLNATTANIGGNVLIYGGTLSICGNIQPTAGGTYYLGFNAYRWAGVYATNMNSNGTITAAEISASGAISGASLSATGAIGGASLSVSGTIAGGAISGSSLSVTGAISGTSLTVTGNVGGATISAASMSTTGSGSIGTTLGVGGLATLVGINLGTGVYATPYTDQGTNGIGWGNVDGSYSIRTQYRNYGSYTYTRLQLNWHTGVEIGGNSSYGGTRFFNNSPGATASQIFSVGDGDNHVRVAYNLGVGGSISATTATITTGNITTVNATTVNATSFAGTSNVSICGTYGAGINANSLFLPGWTPAAGAPTAYGVYLYWNYVFSQLKLKRSDGKSAVVSLGGWAF